MPDFIFCRPWRDPATF
jgi:hypothetical protein